MDWLRLEQWSPYVVGIGIGILSWLTFLFSDKALGCSTAFARIGGMVERLFRGDAVLKRQYFKRYVPELTWGVMLVIGVVIGGFISSVLSGTFALTWTPALWVTTFGPTYLPRLLAAVAGGALLGFGARWAGGCTSGHGISGTLQLAVSSWLAAICFFIGGTVTAMVIYHVIGG